MKTLICILSIALMSSLAEAKSMKIKEITSPIQVENMNLTINTGGDCSGNKININKTSEDQLTFVDGIGASKAAAIVNDIDINGLIDSCVTLAMIPGISDATALVLCDEFDVSIP